MENVPLKLTAFSSKGSKMKTFEHGSDEVFYGWHSPMEYDEAVVIIGNSFIKPFNSWQLDLTPEARYL